MKNTSSAMVWSESVVVSLDVANVKEWAWQYGEHQYVEQVLGTFRACIETAANRVFAEPLPQPIATGQPPADQPKKPGDRRAHPPRPPSYYVRLHGDTCVAISTDFVDLRTNIGHEGWNPTENSASPPPTPLRPYRERAERARGLIVERSLRFARYAKLLWAVNPFNMRRMLEGDESKELRVGLSLGVVAWPRRCLFQYLAHLRAQGARNVGPFRIGDEGEHPSGNATLIASALEHEAGRCGYFPGAASNHLYRAFDDLGVSGVSFSPMTAERGVLDGQLFWTPVGFRVVPIFDELRVSDIATCWAPVSEEGRVFFEPGVVASSDTLHLPWRDDILAQLRGEDVPESEWRILGESREDAAAIYQQLVNYDPRETFYPIPKDDLPQAACFQADFHRLLLYNISLNAAATGWLASELAAYALINGSPRRGIRLLKTEGTVWKEPAVAALLVQLYLHASIDVSSKMAARSPPPGSLPLESGPRATHGSDSDRVRREQAKRDHRYASASKWTTTLFTAITNSKTRLCREVRADVLVQMTYAAIFCTPVARLESHERHLWNGGAPSHDRFLWPPRTRSRLLASTRESAYAEALLRVLEILAHCATDESQRGATWLWMVPLALAQQLIRVVESPRDPDDSIVVILDAQKGTKYDRSFWRIGDRSFDVSDEAIWSAAIAKVEDLTQVDCKRAINRIQRESERTYARPYVEGLRMATSCVRVGALGLALGLERVDVPRQKSDSHKRAADGRVPPPEEWIMFADPTLFGVRWTERTSSGAGTHVSYDFKPAQHARAVRRRVTGLQFVLEGHAHDVLNKVDFGGTAPAEEK